MLYIKCTKDYLEYFEKTSNFPDFLKKIIFIYRRIFKKVTKVKNEYGEVWLIPENNLKFQKEIIKQIHIYQVKTLVLSNNLEELRSKLENLKINVLSGKWLYRFLMKDIIEFICEKKSSELVEQSITLAIKNPQDVDYENLKILAKESKAINLVTKDDFKFRRLENSLYNEQGIVLNISYNYKRSFLKSDIIINIDLDEKEFNKFALPRKAVVININDMKIYNKGFNGINILKYRIELPEVFENDVINTSYFNKEILYESFSYKNTSPQNILNKIKHDNIKIKELIGKNGSIDKKEFAKV